MERFDIEGGLLFPAVPGGRSAVDDRLNRAAHAGDYAAACSDVNAWYEDWDNNREGLARVLVCAEAACERADRDPATLIKTVSPLIRMTVAVGRISDYPASPATSR